MSSDQRLLLMSNDTAAAHHPDYYWAGGRGIFMVTATWGGGSVKLQYQAPDGTWFDVGAAATLTANSMVMVELPPGNVKVVKATATGVYAWLIGTLVGDN
jgi:hypothetical protein